MSQIALSHQERIEAIKRFGYTERESDFLCLAALHGGYFLRRQYARFSDAASGGTPAALIDKVLAHEHANASTYARNTQIYHLCTRPFYAALGQVDNRNRRNRQPLTIKNRLMGLDFVLGHRKHLYLATEQEKVDYFTGTIHVELGALPTKLYPSSNGAGSSARYFVDKYPIYLSGQRDAERSSVSFCFVDAGATSVSGFETYLDQYRRLFTSLPGFEVVYVAGRPLLFKQAERAFRRFVEAIGNGHSTSFTTRLGKMLDYFAVRYLYESGDLTSFDRAKLIQLRDQRIMFSGEENEALYQRWRADREPAGRDVLTTKNDATARFQKLLFHLPFGTEL